MNKKTKKIIEDLGWCVNSDTCIEMWTETAGRDYVIECNKGDSLKETIEKYYSGFDIDEEVELFLEAKRNGFKGVPNASILVKDCEEIEQKLEDLWLAVESLPKF